MILPWMEVYWMTWAKPKYIAWYQWKVSEEKLLMHVRATCASGKLVEIFVQFDNEEAYPLRFKWENDRSFPLINRAGEFEEQNDCSNKIVPINALEDFSSQLGMLTNLPESYLRNLWLVHHERREFDWGAVWKMVPDSLVLRVLLRLVPKFGMDI